MERLTQIENGMAYFLLNALKENKMTEQDKERCREEIVNRGWNRVGQIDPEPDILLWNKDEEVK